MSWGFGDGREERLSAFLQVELPGMSPKMKARRESYWGRRKAAQAEGVALGKAGMIDALIAHNPAYIRELLETEDERFGPGALASRYAATFMVRT